MTRKSGWRLDAANDLDQARYCQVKRPQKSSVSYSDSSSQKALISLLHRTFGCCGVVFNENRRPPCLVLITRPLFLLQTRADARERAQIRASHPRASASRSRNRERLLLALLSSLARLASCMTRPAAEPFATGLNQPRGLVFDDAGNLYVTEAGAR